MSKQLTELPIGMIKNFVSENFENVNYTKPALQFFDDVFLGDIEDNAKLDEFKKLIDVKADKPHIIKEWLKNNYNIDLELDGDYAIAAVLELILEFKRKATSSIIKIKDVNYEAGRHNNCVAFYYKDTKNFNKNRVFKLDLVNDDYEMYVSEMKLDPSIFNKNSLFEEKLGISENSDVILPLVNYKDENDYTASFKGSTMIKKDNGVSYEIESMNTITLLNLGLEKVEVKQAAVMVIGVSGCVGSFKPLPLRIIKDDFYIYIKYKGSLIFGSSMVRADFLESEEL